MEAYEENSIGTYIDSDWEDNMPYKKWSLENTKICAVRNIQKN